jgi:hypothetical protein
MDLIETYGETDRIKLAQVRAQCRFREDLGEISDGVRSGEILSSWESISLPRTKLRVATSVCLSLYGSTGVWTLAAFCFLILHTVLGQGISPSQGRYLDIEQDKHRIKAHNRDIHASSGIWTHDPSVRGGEGGSRVRPRGHCGRHQALHMVH